MTADTNLPTPDTDCSLCGLPAPYCPCDRHDLFTTPNQPLFVERFTVTDDRQLVPMEEAETLPTVEEQSAPGYKSIDDAARSPRNLGMESQAVEPEECELNPYDGTYFEC